MDDKKITFSELSAQVAAKTSGAVLYFSPLSTEFSFPISSSEAVSE